MDKETLHRYFAGKSTSEEEVHIVDWLNNPRQTEKSISKKECFGMLLP